MIDDQAARPPTMADVARAAGVSTAAVSYLLSGRVDLLKRVGPDARERIEQAIDALGYVQNKTARHLRRQRTERICVVLPELGNPFADKMASDIDHVARQRGFTTVVTTAASPDEWQHVFGEVEAGLADAVIADMDGCPTTDIRRLLAPLIRARRPSLVVHPTARPDDFSVVSHDRLGALSKALDHVRSLGHKRLAYVANGSPSPANPRVKLINTFASNQTALVEPLVLGGAHSRRTVTLAARQVLATAPRPSVVLVESDFSAVAMIHEFQRAGLDIPEDIAVIGCGNAEEGQYCTPRLTTIGPVNVSLIEETGHLIDMIERGDKEKSKAFTVPWRLYLRDSG